jgi:hypothetical protein
VPRTVYVNTNNYKLKLVISTVTGQGEESESLSNFVSCLGTFRSQLGALISVLPRFHLEPAEMCKITVTATKHFPQVAQNENDTYI